MERRQLLQLISAWCDGAISDVDFRRLQTELADSPSARSDFFAYMDVHSSVQGYVAARESLEEMLTIDSCEEHATKRSSRESTIASVRPALFGRRRLLVIALAASAVVVL